MLFPADFVGFRVIAGIEDAFYRTVNHFLARRGWFPAPLSYGGYGSTCFFPGRGEDFNGDPGAFGSARVISRVLMQDSSSEADFSASWSGFSRPRRGWRSFVDAQVPDFPVVIQLGAARLKTRTDRGGYVDVVLDGHGLGEGLHFATVSSGPWWAKDGVTRSVQIPVQIVGAGPGHAVVSDVDDTVMVSWLPRPLLALRYAFFSPMAARREVAGMADFLREAGGQAKLFVYLSTGAWNIALFLRAFLARGNFPAGMPLLTDWGPSNSGLFRSGFAHKNAQLRRLHAELPQLKWTLVGDSGQKDPLIYSAFAQEFPAVVQAIAIRELPGLGKNTALHEAAYSKVPTPILRGRDGFALLYQWRNCFR